ncbi:MAG: hypothetical protein V4530_06245 [Pseudomonadota bacterium]
MTGHEHNDAALADVIWWLKGFAAANGNMDSDLAAMSGSLRRLRDWLGQLSRGEYRLLGLTEKTRAIVITEAELEVIFDGTRPQGDASPAHVLAKRLLDAMATEARAEFDEIPF